MARVNELRTRRGGSAWGPGDDRPAVGVAAVRRHTGAPGGNRPGARAGKRRAVPTLARQRRVGGGPPRADGRKAAPAGRRARAPAVVAGVEGAIPADARRSL